MKKQLFNFALCAILAVFAACNSADPTPGASDTTSKTVAKEPVAGTEKLVGGSLDTLWVDSLSFEKLPSKKLVLQYYFGELDTLTLHGWSVKKSNDFNTVANIKFTQGRKSAYSYGPGTYFGDLVLKENELKQIQRALRSTKSQYVLFAPQSTGGHISYTIFVGKDSPSLTKERSFAPAPTGLIANPSPPRNFD